MPRFRIVLLVGVGGCRGTPDSNGYAPRLECSGAVDDNISLVIAVDFTPPAGGVSWVEFGPTRDYGQQTPVVEAVGDAPVHFDLVGNAPDSVIAWHAVAETADGTHECKGSTRTGVLPSDLTLLDVSVDLTESAIDPEAPESYLIGGWYQFGGVGPQIIAARRDGTIVWYYEPTAGEPGSEGTSLDLHYAQDGSGLLYNVYGEAGFGGLDSHIDKISLAGDTLASWTTPLAHHMFTELPDGTLTFQAIDTRSWLNPETGEIETWTGDALVEIAPDGTQSTVFSVWDWLTPSQNAHTSEFDPYAGFDWTQGNLVHYDATKEQYLLSLANAADVIDIARTTDGSTTVVDIYGLDGVPADPVFDYPHGPNWLENGNLLMFMTESAGSGAIEYSLADGTPREVWRHGFEQGALALGQAIRLPSGNTFINYGANLTLQEVTPAGEVVWQALPKFRSATSFPGQFMVTSNLYTGEP